MKKGRPGSVVHVLCDPSAAPRIRAVLRAETGTLGVRASIGQRWPAARSFDTVEVDGNLIRMKVSPGRVKAEHDDVARAARRIGQTLREVAFRAETTWRRRQDAGARRIPTDGRGLGRLSRTGRRPPLGIGDRRRLPLPLVPHPGQPVPLVGLEVVVPVAQPGEIGQGGGPVVAERQQVVDLQRVAAAAAGDHAHRIPFDQRGADGRRNGAAGVGHRGHVHPVGEQHAEDGVGGQPTGDVDGDGPDTGDLTDLPRFEMPAHQRLVVDPDVHHGGGSRRRPG